MNTHAPTQGKPLLDADGLGRTLSRIAHEIIEGNPELDDVALVGIQTRGVPLARRLAHLIEERAGVEPALGAVDITFYRDDVTVRGGEAPLAAQPVVRSTALDFPLDGKTVVLVDDVLYTGRTIRAAIEALFDYGRPERSQLAVLVDRGQRQLPSGRTTSARTFRPPATSASRCSCSRWTRSTASCSSPHQRRVTMADIRVMREDLRPPASPPRRHFISIKDVTREDIERLLATARTFERSLDREVKKLPTLKGRLVINMFFESSTRTSSSFELAAKRLSADTLSIKSSGSSVDKGESLKDTAITLGAYDPDVIVIRHPQIGAPRLVARVTEAHIVNAGDGKHQHPTQALLDLYTMREE